MFVPGSTSRALLLRQHWQRGVVGWHAGDTVAPGACTAAGPVEKGIEATLQCALRATRQFTPVRLRHLHLHFGVSLCAHLASRIAAGSVRTSPIPQSAANRSG